MKKKLLLGIFALAMVLVAAPAFAGVIVLNFEGINAPGVEYTPIGNFYSGLGITFSDNALDLCLNTPGNFCSNTSRGGLGDPNSQTGSLFFLSGSETYMNVAGGFTTGFSLMYTAINYAGSLNVYDGPNGTGTVLATLALPLTPSSCDSGTYGAGFCPFFPVGVAFSGTAYSIGFAGVANQIVFDDVTFGSTTPGGQVPEPTTLLLIGSGLVGIVRKLRN